MSEKRCYTVQELQEILGVSRPTIYNLLKKKEFRWIQLDGGKYRMASIRERNGKFNVIYSYTNEKGERKQKWETYETKAEAKRRKKEIEYKKEMGSFVVRKCKTLDELITEYVAL